MRQNCFQVDGEAFGPGYELNPLNDCKLLRPAVVHLPSILHRIDPTPENGSDAAAGMSTTSLTGSPSAARKTRTYTTAADVVGSSPSQSPYQSPKMKSRSCHHHQQQHQGRVHSNLFIPDKNWRQEKSSGVKSPNIQSCPNADSLNRKVLELQIKDIKASPCKNQNKIILLTCIPKLFWTVLSFPELYFFRIATEAAGLLKGHAWSRGLFFSPQTKLKKHLQLGRNKKDSLFP